jgi:hypothetical protein
MRVVGGSRDKAPSSTSDLAADLDSHWQIFLKHKAGSLEAAVGERSTAKHWDQSRSSRVPWNEHHSPFDFDAARAAFGGAAD